MRISNSLLRFIIYLASIALIIISSDKSFTILGFVGLCWLFFTGLANDIVERIAGKNSSSEGKTKHGGKYELISFNDAVAEELMLIRSDLVRMKLNQNNNYNDAIIPPLRARESYETYGEWSHARSCNNFFQAWFMCFQYPSSFLCQLYETPSGSYGRIIIALDEIYLDDIFDSRERGSFNAELLRKIHSRKFHKITQGMILKVYVCEPEEFDPPTELRVAKVLSIGNIRCGEDWTQTSITLEIDLNEIGYPSEGTREPNKIIRKLNIYDNEYIWLVADENKNTKSDPLYSG